MVVGTSHELRWCSRLLLSFRSPFVGRSFPRVRTRRNNRVVSRNISTLAMSGVVAATKASESDSDATEPLPPAKKARKTSVANNTNNNNNKASELTPTVRIGNTDVPAFGFGTLAMSVLYPDEAARPTRAQAIEIVHDLLDAGCRLFDTADTYCGDPRDLHYAERVLCEAFASYPGGPPPDLFVASKGGMIRIGSGTTSSSWRPGSVKPDSVKKQIRDAFEALGRRRIDLWQLHHVSVSKDKLLQTTVDAVRAVHEMIDEGLVRYCGLCNASVGQLEACKNAGLSVHSLQNEFSVFSMAPSKRLLSPKHLTSPRGTLRYCIDNNIAFIAYAPLGGLKTRRGERTLPAVVTQAASRLGVSPHALLLALLVNTHQPVLATIAGPRRKEHAIDSTKGASNASKVLSQLKANERDELLSLVGVDPQ